MDARTAPRGPGHLDRTEGPVGPDRSAGTTPLLIVAAVWAGVTLLVLSSWVVLGPTWWSIPLDLTTPFWTGGAAPVLLLALALRRWRAAALLAVPVAAFVWIYGTAFVGGAESGAAPELTVATYNTYVGAPDAQHVVALVETAAPDVLLLQELFPDRQAALADLLADELPHQRVAPTAGVGGVAVLSRFTVLDTEVVPPPREGSRAALVVTLDVDGEPVQVAAVHLTSPCQGECGPMLPRLRLEAGARAAEIDRVLDALDPDVPAIVGGDLNSTERSIAYRRLVRAGFEDPQRAAGSGLGFTWPARDGVVPLLRIDAVLVRGLEPVSAYVTPSRASDHRAVVVGLTR